MVHLAVSRENNWSLSSWLAAKDNGLIMGVNFVVWGLRLDLQGPRWPTHCPLPQVRWVERRKGAFGSFQRVLLVLTLLETTKDNGLVLGVIIVVWGL